MVSETDTVDRPRSNWCSRRSSLPSALSADESARRPREEQAAVLQSIRTATKGESSSIRRAPLLLMVVMPVTFGFMIDVETGRNPSTPRTRLRPVGGTLGVQRPA